MRRAVPHGQPLIPQSLYAKLKLKMSPCLLAQAVAPLRTWSLPAPASLVAFSLLSHARTLIAGLHPSMGPSPGALLQYIAAWLTIWERVPHISDREAGNGCEERELCGLAAIGRRERRHLTWWLNTWHFPEPPQLQRLTCWSWSPPQVRWSKRCRCLFKRQCANWKAKAPRQTLYWSGWPLRGQRIGEAGHPGPPDGTGDCRERSPLPGRRAASSSARCGIHPTCRPEARAAAVDAADPMEVDGLELPSLQAIQSARTPTLRHVPAAARHTWCQTLTRALAAVAHRNDEQAWRKLLMLPKCILCAPLRSGRKHKRAVAAFTLDRLQRWQDGERMSLWDSHSPHEACTSHT